MIGIPESLESLSVKRYLQFLEAECAAYVALTQKDSVLLKGVSKRMLELLKEQINDVMTGLASSALREKMMDLILGSKEFPSPQYCNVLQRQSSSSSPNTSKNSRSGPEDEDEEDDEDDDEDRVFSNCPNTCCTGAYIQETMVGVIMSADIRQLIFNLDKVTSRRRRDAHYTEFNVPVVLSHLLASTHGRYSQLERIVFADNFIRDERSSPFSLIEEDNLFMDLTTNFRSKSRFFAMLNHQNAQTDKFVKHFGTANDHQVVEVIPDNAKSDRKGLVVDLLVLFRDVVPKDLGYYKLTELTLKNNIQCELYSKANFQFELLARIGFSCPRLRILDIFGTDTWADCLIAFFFRDAFHSLHRYLFFMENEDDENSAYHPHDITRYCQFCLDQLHPNAVERPFTINPIIPLIDNIYDYVLKKYPKRSFCILRNCVKVSDLLQAPYSTIYELERPCVNNPPSKQSDDLSSKSNRGIKSRHRDWRQLSPEDSKVKKSSKKESKKSGKKICKKTCRKSKKLLRKTRKSLRLKAQLSSIKPLVSNEAEGSLISTKELPCNELSSLKGDEIRNGVITRSRKRKMDSLICKWNKDSSSSSSSASKRSKRDSTDEVRQRRGKSRTSQNESKFPTHSTNDKASSSSSSNPPIPFENWKSSKTWKYETNWIEPELIKYREIRDWPHLNECIKTLEVLNIGGTNVLGEFIPFILLHTPNLKSLGQWINTMVYGLEIIRKTPGYEDVSFSGIQEFSYSTDRNYFGQPYVGFVPESAEYKNVRKEMIRISGKVATRLSPSARNHEQKRKQIGEDVDLIVDCCPNIKKLNIVFHYKQVIFESRESTSVWVSLLHLVNFVELDLVTVKFANVKTLLTVVGARLEHLTLEMDEEQSSGSEIVHIASTCPNLVSLRILVGDKILRGEITLHFTSTFFPKLERLTVEGAVHLQGFAFLWGHCHKLKYMKIGLVISNDVTTSNVLIHDVFALLFQVNKMEFLEELHIKNLKIRTLMMGHFLLDKLPNLKKASNWILEMIDPDTPRFKKYIKKFKEKGLSLEYKEW
ncbi:unnamed protein product [Lepeophtheirus salmonis]|uniref:(salmon louse) hypothetical protein n=1 Tax=Lepeophtheirus salmonis TaxID=72036 RepID=A0A7R8HBK9_LEPSM|nr:unnamed protein product [Lepeophtheirus salmonis]CAF2987981.1 unnamed protein product [Lepeophtheirus salmonis]